MHGKIVNGDSFDLLDEVARECENPIIVTDPPFNVGYHYRSYVDKVPEDVYYASLADMFSQYPSVVVHYPEALHRLSIEMGIVPTRVASWVYTSNTKRQHRDIAFYNVSPDFNKVRQPCRDSHDKRNASRIENGVRSYDWMQYNQVKHSTKANSGIDHPCVMNLDVMRRVVRTLPWGVVVIDPFAGSGTTCVACEEAGIEWRAIEIDEHYCQLIKERVDACEPLQMRLFKDDAWSGR